MSLLTALNHVFNFCLPAIWVGALLAFLGRRAAAAGGGTFGAFVRSWFINALVGIGVWVGGLIAFGVDAKMATYGALVVAISAVQWLRAPK